MTDYDFQYVIKFKYSTYLGLRKNQKVKDLRKARTYFDSKAATKMAGRYENAIIVKRLNINAGNGKVEYIEAI